MFKIAGEEAMIRVQLSKRQQKELEKFRCQASSKDAEKALMILMNAEEKSVPQIANLLKRNQHTVRDWLKRYQSYGIQGLQRKYSPGRPKEKREKLMQYIETIISDLPLLQGYQENVWTVPLITHAAKKKFYMEISKDTVIRALKSMGYTYKRPAKTVPGTAPSPDEKRMAIKRIVGEIKELMKKKECEIYALDESHFSTEPYLVQGWFKKRWPLQDSNTSQAGKSHILWLLESNETKILLEVQAV
jgi:transposase